MTTYNTLIKEHNKNKDDIVEINEQLAENVQQIILKTKADNIYAKAIGEMFIPPNALDNVKKAMYNCVVNVGFWGDSITAEADQIYYGDAYTQKIQAQLIKQFPNVTFNFRNYAIGSCNLSQAVSDSFRATKETTRHDFWNNNLSWKDNVKSFNPDLIIVAFGMNDCTSQGSSSYLEGYNLSSLIHQINLWTKVPTVVFVTTMLPTKDTALYSQREDLTMSVARAVREFAYNNKFALADVNRLYRILKDGLDDVNRIGTNVFLPSVYPTGFTGNTSSYTKNADTLVGDYSVNKFITYNRNFYNGNIFSFLGFREGAPAEISYRVSDMSGIKVKITPGASAKVELFNFDDTLLASATLTPNNANYTVNIDAIGSRHIITVDNVVKIDIITYWSLCDGLIKLGSTSITPDFAATKITFNDEIKTVSLYNELDLIGEYNNSLESGNGINHPTALAHSIAYFPSFNNILKDLNRPHDKIIQYTTPIASVNCQTGIGSNPTGQVIYYSDFYITSNIDGKSYNKAKGAFLKNMDTGVWYKLVPDAGIFTDFSFVFQNATADIDRVQISTDVLPTKGFELYRYGIN